MPVRMSQKVPQPPYNLKILLRIFIPSLIKGALSSVRGVRALEIMLHDLLVCAHKATMGGEPSRVAGVCNPPRSLPLGPGDI